MTTLPPLPFAVFDEFGAGADDRVQDYARAYGAACAAAAAAAERERVANLCDANAQVRRAWYTRAESDDDRGAAEMAEWLATVIRQPGALKESKP